MVQLKLPLPDIKIWGQKEITQWIEKADKNKLTRPLLKMVHLCQAPLEEKTQSHRFRNNLGFYPYDTKIITSIAQFFKQRGFITDKQASVVKNILLKHTGQLTKIANKKITEPPPNRHTI